MSSKTPIVRQTAWIALFPQLLFMGVLVLGFYLLESREPVLYGALSYLALSFGIKTFFTKEHKKGMRLVHQHKMAEAIPCFENSYAFFDKNPWLDKYRYLTLLSASRISYREMALCNIAFCYGQIGQQSKAVVYYKEVLKEFPDSGMAQSALRMLDSDEELNNSIDLPR